MTAMLMHCHQEFRQLLNETTKHELVFDAFSALEESIMTLDVIDQLEWYSAATQVLISLVKNRCDPLNPLDVFKARANFILYGKNPTSRAFGLGLAVVVIGLGTLLLAAAAGLGIGVLLGLWATPVGFIASLLALQTAPLIIAAVSPVIATGVATVSGLLFFKKPAIERAFEDCVEAIKLNHLPKTHAYKEEELSYQDKHWSNNQQLKTQSI